MPVLLGGAWQTLILATTTILLASLVAVPLALGSLSANRLVSVPISTFSWAARGIPALVFLLIGFYGFSAFGLRLEPLPTAILALTLSASPYYMEILRGGLKAIPRGQYEAARALGLSPVRTSRRIVLPQVVRIVRPPYLASTTGLVKNSALASVIGVPELLSRSRHFIEFAGYPFEVLLLAAVFFVVVNSMLLVAGRPRGRGAPVQ